MNDFGKIAQPLFDATRATAGDVVKWTGPRQESFHLLREALCDSCVLYVPCVADSFVLTCDASYSGVGAVLCVCRDGVKLPVGFFSRQLRGAEKRYPATELECLGILEAVVHFEVYLQGAEFKIVTNHRALEAI